MKQWINVEYQGWSSTGNETSKDFNFPITANDHTIAEPLLMGNNGKIWIDNITSSSFYIHTNQIYNLYTKIIVISRNQ